MKIKRCFRDKRHPLILREKKMNENENENKQAEIIICRICTRTISEASFYACDVCEYYLHNSCTELPHEINNSLHHPHPLKLVERGLGWCHSCGGVVYYVPLYRCPPLNHGCSFEMDVECALMPTRSTPWWEGEARRSILHFSHKHSLSLVDLHTDDKDVKTIECYGCRSTCSGLAYGCTKCNIFLHKSCAELPRKIQHPLHPRHGFLSLRFGIYYDNCFLCERSNPSQVAFFLQCCDRDCDFRLCWSCSQKKRRSIVYEGHDHNLHFVEKNIETEIAMCNGYYGYCAQPIAANSSELSRTKSNIFVCMECDFKVHMLCGPLPATIKHEYHIHRLTLVDFVIEEDYDEYCCDVCETKRDPRIRLYYCEECKYFAHVHCLFSEIAKALIEEDQLREDDVELKIVGQDIWDLPPKLRNNENKLDLTLADVLNKLSKKERSGLTSYYTWEDTSASKSKSDTLRNPTPPQSELMSAQEVDEILKLIRFTDSDFESFFEDQLENFYYDNTLPLKSSDLKLKTVEVEGYMVPHTVGRVMRVLLHRYGDISSVDSSFRSREWKSVVYFVLCEALRRMSTTLVVDITKGDLQEWYYHLYFASDVCGFKVDFACVHLERLVRTFLGLQADKLKDQVPARLRQDVAILEGKVTELKREIAELQREIAEKMSKLDMCEEYSGPSSKSQFMSDCLKEGSDMKRKTAWDQHLFSHCSSFKPTAKYWE